MKAAGLAEMGVQRPLRRTHHSHTQPKPPEWLRKESETITYVGNALIDTCRYWHEGGNEQWVTRISAPDTDLDCKEFTYHRPEAARMGHMETLDMVKEHLQDLGKPSEIRLGSDADVEERHSH